MTQWYCSECRMMVTPESIIGDNTGYETVYRHRYDGYVLTAIPDGVKVDGECPECHEIVYSDFNTKEEGMAMHYAMKHRDKGLELGILKEYKHGED